jgi:hypothetical protein
MKRLWCRITLHRPARWPRWGTCLGGRRTWEDPVVRRLKLALIEAQNPGIDMAEVTAHIDGSNAPSEEG